MSACFQPPLVCIAGDEWDHTKRIKNQSENPQLLDSAIRKYLYEFSKQVWKGFTAVIPKHLLQPLCNFPCQVLALTTDKFGIYIERLKRFPGSWCNRMWATLAHSSIWVLGTSTIFISYTFDTHIYEDFPIDTDIFKNPLFTKRSMPNPHTNQKHVESCFSVFFIPFRAYISACCMSTSLFLWLSPPLSFGFDMTPAQS